MIFNEFVNIFAIINARRIKTPKPNVILIMNSFLKATFLFITTISIPSWKEFRSAEGRFRVLTPGDLILKKAKIKTQVGTLDYNTYYFQTKKGGGVYTYYAIQYYDYPEGTIHQDSTALIEELMDTTVQSSLKSVKGELLYQSKVEDSNYPSRIWRMDFGNAFAKSKCFLNKNHFIMIQYITLKSNTSLDGDKFLNSLRILD